MGAVFRPKDLGRANRRIIENALKDLSPDTKDSVIKLLNSWEGKTSGKKLKHILGQNEAEELLRNIADDVSLSEDERSRIRNSSKESNIC
jgi:hypothetical protein